MRSREDPLKWPVAISLTLVLLFVGIFFVPSSWIDFIFSPTHLSEHGRKTSAETPWLIILPPPVMEVIPEVKHQPKEEDPPPERPTFDDPAWWTKGWRVRIGQETTAIMAPASADSLAVVLEVLGVGLDFTQKALPDSVLNHQLMLLRIEDSFAFEELKPYLSALTRARAHADRQSREADMFDDHLQSQIMVPDKGESEF